MQKLLEIIKDLELNDISPGNQDAHYDGTIQPIELIESQNLPFDEGNIVKYICRHPKKGKSEDVLKVIWYCLRILNRDYPEVFKTEKLSAKGLTKWLKENKNHIRNKGEFIPSLSRDQLREDIYSSIPIVGMASDPNIED